MYHICELETHIITMKHKSISTQSAELLAFFNERNKSCFDYKEASQALPDSNDAAIRKLLSDITKRGPLMRIKEVLFYIIPYQQDAESFIPDWHILAEYLVSSVRHYIGYYSALQIHGFITQPSLKEQIVVEQQIRPSVIKIKNVPFQFIYHNEKHFFGAKKIWKGNLNKVICSDLEKTFIDCLFKPDYAGGTVEVAKAIHASKDKIKWDRLPNYAFKFDSHSVVKRLGFLLETLGIGREITGEPQK